MHRIYIKSEIWFAVLWIIIYVVGTSIADGVCIGFDEDAAEGICFF